MFYVKVISEFTIIKIAKNDIYSNVLIFSWNQVEKATLAANNPSAMLHLAL